LCAPGASPSISEEQQLKEKEGDSSRKDEVLLNVIRPDYERPDAPPPVEPLYPLRDDGKVQGEHALLIFEKRMKMRQTVHLLKSRCTQCGNICVFRNAC